MSPSGTPKEVDDTLSTVALRHSTKLKMSHLGIV